MFTSKQWNTVDSWPRTFS